MEFYAPQLLFMIVVGRTKSSDLGQAIADMLENWIVQNTETRRLAEKLLKEGLALARRNVAKKIGPTGCGIVPHLLSRSLRALMVSATRLVSG